MLSRENIISDTSCSTNIYFINEIMHFIIQIYIWYLGGGFLKKFFFVF